MPFGYNPIRKPKVASFVRLCALTALLAPLAAQAATQTYSTVGSFTWTVPQGVTSLNVTATGGGGGGGGITNGVYAPGVGGAGGVVTTSAWAVTPGQTVNIVVGGPGTFVTNASGGGGGASSLNMGSAWIIAGGGGGGAGYAAASSLGSGGHGCGGNGAAGGVAPAGGGGAGGGGGNGGAGGAGAGTGGVAGAAGGNGGNGGPGGMGFNGKAPGNNGGAGSGSGAGGAGGPFNGAGLAVIGGGGGGGGGYGGGGGGGSGDSTGGGGGGGGSTGGTCTAGSNGGAGGASGKAGSVSFSYTAYTLGGTITGLTAGGLVLSAGTTPNQTVSPASGATAFTFANAFMGNYNVTVQTQPTGLLCTVTNGSGSISTANVTNVAVACLPAADLSITKTDGVTSVTAGGSVGYTITASNAGPNPVTGAKVIDTFPSTLSSCTWTCSGSAGGICTASGSGNISDTVNLPVGASVTYSTNCTLATAAGATLSNTAIVAAPATAADPNLANNGATDTDTVMYTITGSVSPDANFGSISCTPASVPYGGSASCTATPKPRYMFLGFSGDCTGITCNLSNIQSNKVVTAKFALVTAIPTLSQWGLMLLGLLAAGLGARRLRRL